MGVFDYPIVEVVQTTLEYLEGDREILEIGEQELQVITEGLPGPPGPPGETNVESISYTTAADPLVLTVKDALDKLLYVPPVITGFSNSVGTVEKGQTLDAVTLSWSTNKSLTLTLDGAPVVGSPLALSGLALTADKTWTLSGTDGKNTVTRTTSVSFRQKRYWGTSPLETLDSAGILALLKEFSTSRVQARTFDGQGQFLYFAYPASWGNASFKVNGLVNSAWIVSTVPFTNASGWTEDYLVYRSQYLQNGSGIQVEVS